MKTKKQPDQKELRDFLNKVAKMLQVYQNGFNEDLSYIEKKKYNLQQISNKAKSLAVEIKERIYQDQKKYQNGLTKIRRELSRLALTCENLSEEIEEILRNN